VPLADSIFYILQLGSVILDPGGIKKTRSAVRSMALFRVLDGSAKKIDDVDGRLRELRCSVSILAGGTMGT
jgi:hypothetical protein